MIDALARLRAMDTSLPQLFRVTLESEAIRALCGLLQVVGSDNVVISVRGHDSLSHDVLALREPAYKKVEAAILARVASSLELDESGFLAASVVAAVLLGRRPISVRTLAEAVNVPPKSLRQRLHEVAGIDASTLLRWVFMLHCLGAAELLGKPLKCIANEVGYKRPESLTNRWARLRGARFRRTMKRGGFAHTLNDFAEWLVVNGNVTMVVPEVIPED